MNNIPNYEKLSKLKYWDVNDKVNRVSMILPDKLLPRSEIEDLSNKLLEKVNVYKDHVCFSKLQDFYGHFNKLKTAIKPEIIDDSYSNALNSLKSFTFCWEKVKKPLE